MMSLDPRHRWHVTTRVVPRALAWALLAGAGAAACAEGTPGNQHDAGRDAATTDTTPDQGRCVAACSIWSLRCGDRCIDPASSVTDCGNCGASCEPSTQVCRAGGCVTVAGSCTALPLASPSDAGTAQGLRGEYFAEPDLTTLKRVRVDPAVDFDWSAAPPDPDLGGPDNYSVRWRGTVSPRYSERYTFTTRSDDGMRLYVDDALVIDNWTPQSVTESTGTVDLRAGARHAIRVEYFQVNGPAIVQLYWSSASQAREIVPAARLAPAADAAFACTGGECCPTGGAVPVCCPSGSRCVMSGSTGVCCPPGADCTTARLCSAS